MQMQDQIIPIFIISLPRSGSTLLQRLMANQKEIATVSEPWILLPFLSTLREKGTFTDYRHFLAFKGIEDFYNNLAEGRKTYLAEMRTFVLNLYKQIANKSDAIYFLDKTPRYHLVIPEIIELFPEAKFIFLWRNPLAIVASMVDLFENKHWQVYRFQIDLFDGVLNMVAAIRDHPEKIYSIRYESLIQEPESQLISLFNFLELERVDDRLLSIDDVVLRGRLGDKIGVNQYRTISEHSLSKWTNIINNPLRKAWCRRYLNWIGSERLKIMGYDLEGLLNQLNQLSSTHHYLLRDLISMSYSPFYRILEPHILKSKLPLLSEHERIYAHL